jgi:hypothetical protein
MAKAKKLTVAELKRRLVPGAKVVMVEFCGQQVNKRCRVSRVATSYVAMLDDELDSKQESVIIWPKAKQLKEVDGGFRIDTNHSTLIYKWVSDDSGDKA